MQEGRRSVIGELNPEYAALAQSQIDAAWLDGAAQMDVFRHSAPGPNSPPTFTYHAERLGRRFALAFMLCDRKEWQLHNVIKKWINAIIVIGSLD